MGGGGAVGGAGGGMAAGAGMAGGMGGMGGVTSSAPAGISAASAGKAGVSSASATPGESTQVSISPAGKQAQAADSASGIGSTTHAPESKGVPASKRVEGPQGSGEAHLDLHCMHAGGQKMSEMIAALLLALLLQQKK